VICEALFWINKNNFRPKKNDEDTSEISDDEKPKPTKRHWLKKLMKTLVKTFTKVGRPKKLESDMTKIYDEKIHGEKGKISKEILSEKIEVEDKGSEPVGGKGESRGISSSR